jgi:dephospho-CoA kinase
MTTLIGLTGGIGSGKSTVAHYLENCGAAVIDADKVGHEALKHDTPAWHEIVDEFGTSIVGSDGEIDRKKLGQVVFGDGAARQRLNRIMWDRIWEMIMKRVDGYRAAGRPVVVVEAFGLIEAGWDKLVDQVWVVEVSQQAVIERLKKQRRMTEAEIISRIESQLSPNERAKHANVVIQNEGSPKEVEDLVKQLYSRLPMHASS